MNRFEALHTLGLEENASEEDVRLAYYGLEKAVRAFDFSDAERIAARVEGLLEHAKEARRFLLSARNQTVARKVRSYAAKQRGKLTVTPVQEKTARLHGLEQLRGLVVAYHGEERGKRRTSIFVLVVCIIVSFVALRYLRAMPRVVAFTVLGAVAIGGSTVLTQSHLQVRKARAHVLEIDDAIAALRRELGLEPAEEDGYDAAEAVRRADAAARGLTSDDAADVPQDADAYEIDEDAEPDLAYDGDDTPDSPDDAPAGAVPTSRTCEGKRA